MCGSSQTGSVQYRISTYVENPDDSTAYSLPPGLGSFPLKHLVDYSDRLPESYLERGGVIIPMHQAEALWISFSSKHDYPFAVKIATGKICAVTGDRWINHLNRDPQDYVVIPQQPWLDGYCVGKGVIRQFVAMPLGKRFTVEEQLTGESEVGGIQIVVYPMKRSRYKKLMKKRSKISRSVFMSMDCLVNEQMGSAPGGTMHQQIDEDEYGLDLWDMRRGSRCFVTIANSDQWKAITGEAAPSRTVTADAYTQAGLPWFDYYSEKPSVSATGKLKGVKSVERLLHKKGEPGLGDKSIACPKVIKLHHSLKPVVREYSD